MFKHYLLCTCISLNSAGLHNVLISVNLSFFEGNQLRKQYSKASFPFTLNEGGFGLASLGDVT